MLTAPRARRGRAPARARRAALLLALAVPAAGLLGIPAAGAAAQDVGQQARSADLAVLRAMRVPAAWRASRGSGVTVAVLDTGADPAALDLPGVVTTGPDYTRGADPAGYQPPHLHGTYIASLIAGRGNGPGRAEGVIGVAPQARILSVRVILDDSEPGFGVYNENADYYDAIASGIRYAVRHGASVINMSLGSTVATRSMRQAIGFAVSRNVVVVAAAGNDGQSGGRYTPYSYPASFSGVISVAAVSAGGQRASFSDQNSSVVISAPGVGVVGDGPGRAYLRGSGTSPASALVAGVAALIRSKYPRLSPALVTQAIVGSARRVPHRGYSTATGFGEADAAAALARAGRLAGQAARPAGLATGAHFGGGPAGPVVVVPRDLARIAATSAIAAAALLCFVATVIALTVRRRRRRAAARRPARLAPPAAP